MSHRWGDSILSDALYLARQDAKGDRSAKVSSFLTFLTLVFIAAVILALVVFVAVLAPWVFAAAILAVGCVWVVWYVVFVRGGSHEEA